MRDLIALRQALPSLSARDARFAQDLLDKSQYGLSEKQLYWVRKLASGNPRPAVVNVGAFDAVIKMFKAASEHKKKPKIRLKLDDGRKVVLDLAGANASQPGTVNVTDGGRFGDNVWYGRVTPAGEWQPSAKVDALRTASVTALLRNFAINPLGVAKAYGEETGSCCFCGLTLTDPRSVTAGYGPICAENHGLAWG